MRYSTSRSKLQRWAVKPLSIFAATLLLLGGCDSETPSLSDTNPLDSTVDIADATVVDVADNDLDATAEAVPDAPVSDVDASKPELPADVPLDTVVDIADSGVDTTLGDDGGTAETQDDVLDVLVDVTAPDAADGIDDVADDATDATTEVETDAGSGATFSVTGGPYGVSPGDESTICVVRNLGNPAAARVAAIHTSLEPGSHHMIVSRVNGNATVDVEELCSPFEGGLGASDTLFIAEQPQASLIYPDGAALEISANQLIRIEIHYLNYYPQSIDVSGTVDFELVPPAAGETSPAQFKFDGSLSLYLPANQLTTKVSSHSVPAGAHVFALTSHTHKLGVKATIHRTLAGGQKGELLHESNSWADPPLDQFDPPLVFASGEGLELTCEYNNPTDNAVTFGLSANDEMCFLWAHYFIP